MEPTATSSAAPSATLKPRRHTSATALVSTASAFTSTQASSVSRPPPLAAPAATPAAPPAPPPRRSNCTASAGLLTAHTDTSRTAVLRAESCGGERERCGGAAGW